MMDSNVREIELTRFWRDGGRDGLGKYRIGTKATEILVDFALEAKCKEPSIDRRPGPQNYFLCGGLMVSLFWACPLRRRAESLE
jgi:hypothetical protein